MQIKNNYCVFIFLMQKFELNNEQFWKQLNYSKDPPELALVAQAGLKFYINLLTER